MKKTLNRFALLAILSITLFTNSQAQNGCTREWDECRLNGGGESCDARRDDCMTPDPPPKPDPPVIIVAPKSDSYVIEIEIIKSIIRVLF